MNEDSKLKIQNLFYRQIWPGYDRGMKTKRFFVFIAPVIVLAILGLFLILPPKAYPEGITLTIKERSSLKQISEELKAAKLIRSEIAFQFLVIARGGEKKVIAGDYLFEKRETAWKIAARVIHGQTDIAAVRVTVIEGLNNSEIAGLFSQKFLGFKSDQFLILAKDKEGYLFPDTYFMTPDVKLEKIIQTMNENFVKKISPLHEQINNSSRSLADIITMASIIEKEAGGDDDRKIISGILWKRIDKKMPLQVDASFIYILGKSSSELTLDDLKTDSLYNTYKYLGLPPGPIGNPGLKSIIAALEPESSPYFFYLHDKDGMIHYARNFEGHKQNKSKYLR